MKKKKINEKMAGHRIGLGGMNAAGPYNNRNRTKHQSGYHTGGMQGDADSLYSQRQSLISTLEENEEEKNEGDSEMSEEKKETLYEYFARLAKLPLDESKNVEEGGCNIEEGHCSTHESHCTVSEMHCDEALRMMEEQEVEEASGAGAVGGVMGKFGLFNADGTETSKKQHSSRLNHAKRTFGGK